ncbi:MAG TPA: hypothetical protein DCQ77_06200 [Betaproteobacteria bacterium]|nr:hypothetical protein [Betaproteobacteria bacterium]
MALLQLRLLRAQRTQAIVRPMSPLADNQTFDAISLTGRNGSKVTVGGRLLQSMMIFLVHHKLNSPTADIGELTIDPFLPLAPAKSRSQLCGP